MSEGLREVYLLGVGGATRVADLEKYLTAGAHVVQCASALISDAYFGIRARKHLDSTLPKRKMSLAEIERVARTNWAHALHKVASEKGDTQQTHDAAFSVWSGWKRDFDAAQKRGPLRADPPREIDFAQMIRERLR